MASCGHGRSCAHRQRTTRPAEGARACFGHLSLHPVEDRRGPAERHLLRHRGADPAHHRGARPVPPRGHAGDVQTQLLRSRHRRPRDQADGRPQDPDLVTPPTNAGVRVRVDASALGERWDRALVVALARAGVPCTRSQLARAFAAGDVRTDDGRAVRPGRLVDEATWVSVALPDSPLYTAEPEAIPLAILHEDADLLVVDKPAGMVVHASVGHDAGTLVGAVLHHLGVGAEALPVLPGNDATRPGIVHRLDKDTSGVIVVAKTAFAQARLAEQFQAHRIDRHYLG